MDVYHHQQQQLQLQQQKGSNFPGGSKRDILERVSENHSWIDEISEGKETAEELIEKIIAEIEAKPTYYTKVNEIHTHLNQIMRFFYRNMYVKIELFGSSHTKLAVSDSDVDVYLDFGENLPEPPEKLLRTLKNKVRKYGYFVSAIPIFARVPIVHCVHRNRVSCDISFSNALGVSNSSLIKFLLSLDKRIRPLILMLKYIMKIQGMLRLNSLTSYALNILIVFFLQQLKDPLIPPVSLLQNLASERKIVADWDTSFTTDISSLPVINNQLSVPELLKNFFEFYSNFEFGFYIISVFTGKAHLKPIFSNVSSIPEEFHLYKANIAKNESFKFDNNKFMCTQGPFNHGNNVTRNVIQKSLNQFQSFCCYNAVVGQELLNENILEENKIKYLKELFSHDSSESSGKKLKKEENVVIYVGEKIVYDDSNCTEDSLRDEWTKYVFNNVKDILCKIMKCDVEIENEGVKEKLIKCELHYYDLLTKKRNEAKTELEFPQNMPDISREEIVSNYLCDTVLKNAEKNSLKFKIICSVMKKPTSFCLNLKSEEKEKAKHHLVQQVFQFIRNNFPKWIK